MNNSELQPYSEKVGRHTQDTKALKAAEAKLYKASEQLKQAQIDVAILRKDPNAPRAIAPEEVTILLGYILDGMSNEEALHQLAASINPDDPELKGVTIDAWLERVYTNTFYRMDEVELPKVEDGTEYDELLGGVIPKQTTHPLADELKKANLWVSNKDKYLRTIMNDLQKNMDVHARAKRCAEVEAENAELKARLAKFEAMEAAAPEATPAAVKRAGWKAEATALLTGGMTQHKVAEHLGKSRPTIARLVKELKAQGQL
ncbi:hypothetical protein [Vibrio fluvialis]|uniref:hypothetical protein n=1 Tax=Vibrio fluvialis TaxID=676 RepID=UPI0028F74549|nr:hypothetical protein [Vibrio fluvialis]